MTLFIGTVDPKKTVFIYGGGFCGLTFAYFLKKNNIPFHLYERSNRLGGKLQSSQSAYGLSEWAANAFYATKDMLDFFQELNLKVIPTRKKLKRKIWIQKPKALSPFNFLFLIFKSFYTKHPPIDKHTTLADFFVPLGGKKFVDLILSPALQGIYATGAENLHVLSIWPEVLNKNTKTFWNFFQSMSKAKKQSISFKDGMEAYIDKIKDSIKGHYTLNHISDNYEFNSIFCMDALESSRALKNLWPMASQLLATLDYQPIHSTTVFLKKNYHWMKKSFGILFPRGQGFISIGSLFNHEIFPSRIIPPTLSSLTLIMNTDQFDSLNLKQDLEKLSISHDDVLDIFTHSFTPGLPIYNKKRFEVIESLKNDPSRPKDVILAGNFVNGISLREMYTMIKSHVAIFISVPSLADEQTHLNVHSHQN
jgi:oxygen-dependent protoporphyrinogen oxidase